MAIELKFLADEPERITFGDLKVGQLFIDKDWSAQSLLLKVNNESEDNVFQLENREDCFESILTWDDDTEVQPIKRAKIIVEELG